MYKFVIPNTKKNKIIGSSENKKIRKMDTE